MTFLPIFAMVTWPQVVMSLVAFITGGGLLTIIMEWRYRKLNKKTKTAKSSSESYLDYEKVIDSSTLRLEKLRSKIDRLYEGMDLVKKTNGLLRMKIFEYRHFIKMIDSDHNFRDEERFKDFFKLFDEDAEFDIFDIDGDKLIRNETGKGTEHGVQTRDDEETS